MSCAVDPYYNLIIKSIGPYLEKLKSLSFGPKLYTKLLLTYPELNMFLTNNPGNNSNNSKNKNKKGKEYGSNRESNSNTQNNNNKNLNASISSGNRNRSFHSQSSNSNNISNTNTTGFNSNVISYNSPNLQFNPETPIIDQRLNLNPNLRANSFNNNYNNNDSYTPQNFAMNSGTESPFHPAQIHNNIPNSNLNSNTSKDNFYQAKFHKKSFDQI